MLRRSGLLLTVALVVAAAVANQTRRDGQAHFLSTQRYEDVYYLPPPDWLQVFSIGHREAVAGLIWLRALVYFGDELRQRGGVRHLYQYSDAMLALDPHFKKVYSWVATGALYRTGRITVEDARRAIAYLERAVRLYPDDGELAWSLGATYLYELAGMVPAAERPEIKRRGLEHLQVAARLGAGPPWLALSTATELGRLGKREQQIAHLEELYAQTSDPEIKDTIELTLGRLRSAAYAEALSRTYAELEAGRRRDFPYLERDLYLLVGPKPAFDGQALLLRGFDPDAERFDDEGEGAASSGDL